MRQTECAAFSSDGGTQTGPPGSTHLVGYTQAAAYWQWCRPSSCIVLSLIQQQTALIKISSLLSLACQHSWQHTDASNRKCQVVHTPLTPDDTSVDYNPHNVEFPSPSTPPPAASNSNSNSDSDSSSASMPAQMRIQMQGSSGARVRPKADPQMYGQFEVTAKVDSAAGAVTAFYVSAPSECECDVVLQAPAGRFCVWVLSHRSC